jgi:hypothetical protein
MFVVKFEPGLYRRIISRSRPSVRFWVDSGPQRNWLDLEFQFSAGPGHFDLPGERWGWGRPARDGLARASVNSVLSPFGGTLG